MAEMVNARVQYQVPVYPNDADFEPPETTEHCCHG